MSTSERKKGHPAGEAPPGFVRENLGVMVGWSSLIVASLLAFRLSEGTEYHQLAAGVLMSSSTLFVLLAIFEWAWRFFANSDS